MFRSVPCTDHLVPKHCTLVCCSLLRPTAPLAFGTPTKWTTVYQVRLEESRGRNQDLDGQRPLGNSETFLGLKHRAPNPASHLQVEPTNARDSTRSKGQEGGDREGKRCCHGDLHWYAQGNPETCGSPADHSESPSYTSTCLPFKAPEGDFPGFLPNPTKIVFVRTPMPTLPTTRPTTNTKKRD